MQFRVLVGDITKWRADAIVHSASATLLDVSTQDHALYRAAGISLDAACRSLKGCPEGEAKATKGYKLPATYVIHAVGPYWAGGKRDEEGILVSAYKSAFMEAREKQAMHVALTSISTEDKRYPRSRAAAAVIPVIYADGAAFSRVDMVCADAELQRIYWKAAIYWWLQRIGEASIPEQGKLAEEGAAALVLLPLPDMTPDPLILADKIRYMRSILEAFLKKGKSCTIVDKEQTTAAILSTYNTKPETAVSALNAIIKAYKNSKKAVEGDEIHE